MKRFAKFCLVLAAILCVLGIAGIGAGMALGASPAEFLNTARYRAESLRRNGERMEEHAEELEDRIDDWLDGLEEDWEYDHHR